MLGLCLAAVEARAGKDVFQPTKPHLNVGTLASRRAAAKLGKIPEGKAPTRAAAVNRPDLPLTAGLPDLRIREFQFVPGHAKAVRVRVVNTGAAAAAKNRLRLTVRRIDGVSVGRMEFGVVPALAPGKDVWIVIDAQSILPLSVKLKATTFRLDVDANKHVNESNESNNLEWHNL